MNKYDVPPDKMVVIPIGVDANKFYPIANIKKIPNSILFVGRVEKRKGPDFLIRAMPLVAKKIPEVRLFVGGTGKEVPKLKRYSKEFNLERNVEFLGFVPEGKLNVWYNRVQCVVVPSMFEGFGLTVIEAMAAGTCVVATNVDSLKDIVEDDVSGFLVDYDDVHALSEKIVRLLGDKKKQEEFIEKGKEMVETIFNWDVVMKQNLEELYGPLA
ncbi:glycosyltransferase family 4 protein, partial [bacterium]|nr:glycosyltransferase family 4 protein [bacterium]